MNDDVIYLMALVFLAQQVMVTGLVLMKERPPSGLVVVKDLLSGGLVPVSHSDLVLQTYFGFPWVDSLLLKLLLKPICLRWMDPKRFLCARCHCLFGAG